MFCFSIRRKLYDFVEGNLSEGSGSFSCFSTPHPERSEGSHKILQPFGLQDDPSLHEKNTPRGHLSKSLTEKIEAHLGSCPNCSKEYEGLKRLLSLASQKKAPELSSQFWANFDRGLREKLAKEREMPREIKIKPQLYPRINLRPAYALATVAVLLIAISFYLFGGLPTKGRLIALADERLVNDVEILEELTDESIILDDQDTLLDELTLIY